MQNLDDLAHQIFVEAYGTALTLYDKPGDMKRTRALSDLASHLTLACYFDEAYKAARAIDHTGTRPMALGNLAAALAVVGDPRYGQVLEEARDVAVSRDTAIERAAPLSVIGQCLARSSQFEKAHRIVLAIDDVTRRALALSDLAATMARAGDPQNALILDAARNCTMRIESGPARDEALNKCTEALAYAGYVEEARATVFANETLFAFDGARKALASVLTNKGYFDQALEIVRVIRDDWRRTVALSDLAEALGKAGNEGSGVVFDEACHVAASLSVDIDDCNIACLLSTIAVAMARAVDYRASQIFDEAHQKAIGCDTHGSRPYFLARECVAAAMATVGYVDAARQIALSIETASGKAFVLSGVACALVKKGDPRARPIVDDTFAAALALHRSLFKARVLGSLAVALAQAGDPRARDTLVAAHQAALAIRNAEHRATFLSKLLAAFKNRSKM